MGDFSEFRREWRPLLGAFLGMGSALSLNSYLLSIFAPYLMKSFDWSLSEWARLGMVQMLIMFCLPVAGRLTDKYGVRRVAAVGALSFPVFLVAITMVSSTAGYLAIYIAQTMICSTTTATVYSRVVAASYKVRRGLALGICGSSPPLIGALFSPAISTFVEDHGWRAGYWAVAAFCTVCAVLTLWLLRPDKPKPAVAPVKAGPRPQGVYRTVFAMPVFWIMLAACFLVNLPFTLATTQLKTVVLAQGMTDGTAAMMVTVFAVSSIIGRIVTGVALDYLPGHIIAAVGFALPIFGLVLLASPIDTVMAVAIAFALIGASFGGEGDIIPYLITTRFGIPVYSTVMGMLSAAIGLAMGFGNFLLSLTGSFDSYLPIAAVSAAVGSVLFLISGRRGLQRGLPGEPAQA
jgi:predicted MFS family arabinose efflux permease